MPLCFAWQASCLRLPIALIGSALGLGCVVWASWAAVQLLIPNTQPAAALQKEWIQGRKSAVYRFFSQSPQHLQGFADFLDIEAKEADAYRRRDQLSNQFDDADEDDRGEIADEMVVVDSEILDLLQRSSALIGHANYILLEDAFRKSLGRMVKAAVGAAVGIGLFAWAANPPDPSPPVSIRLVGANLEGADPQGSDLRSADLTSGLLSGADLSRAVLIGAKLTNADLRGANLTGANLRNAGMLGADLRGVIWSETQCPDGEISNDVGGTCEAHLVTD